MTENQVAIANIFLHPDGKRVTVSFHRPSDAFRPKVLKTMIEDQIKWNKKDLKRLKLLK